MEKILECLSKTFISFRLKKKNMDILDDMGVSKLSAKVYYVNKSCSSLFYLKEKSLKCFSFHKNGNKQHNSFPH